jgi:hypothetical protein
VAESDNFSPMYLGVKHNKINNPGGKQLRKTVGKANWCNEALQTAPPKKSITNSSRENYGQLNKQLSELSTLGT